MGGGYSACQSVQGKAEFAQNGNTTKPQGSQAGQSGLNE